jgi:hypothetical protein
MSKPEPRLKLIKLNLIVLLVYLIITHLFMSESQGLFLISAMLLGLQTLILFVTGIALLILKVYDDAKQYLLTGLLIAIIGILAGYAGILLRASIHS